MLVKVRIHTRQRSKVSRNKVTLQASYVREQYASRPVMIDEMQRLPDDCIDNSPLHPLSSVRLSSSRLDSYSKGQNGPEQ
jgi:hypothetical protein